MTSVNLKRLYFPSMHFFKYPICFLLFAIFTPMSVTGTEFKVELLDENDGFASSIIFSIVQDQQGYMWFGTAYDGLLRYDGENVVRYQHHSNDTNSLAHNNAGNLALDSSDNLWVGSWGGSVSQLNQQAATFTRYQHNKAKPDSVSDHRVQAIFEDMQGDIWLGTFMSGLNRFDAQTQTFTRLPFGKITKDSS